MLKGMIEKLKIKKHLSKCRRTMHMKEKDRGKKSYTLLGPALPKKVLGREWSSCWKSATSMIRRQFPTLNTVRKGVVLPSYPLPTLLTATSFQSKPPLLS